MASAPPQFQDGQTRTNRRTGEVQVLRGGQWVTVQPGNPAAPASIQTRPANPALPVELERERVGLERDRVGLERDRQQAATAGRGTPLSEQQQLDLRGRLSGLDGFERTIQEVEQLYQDNLEGSRGGVLGFGGDRNIRARLPWAPTGYGALDAAGGRLMDQIKNAFGITGTEANSAAEVQMRFGPYIPRSTDNDETIQSKLNALRGVLEEQRRIVGGQMEAAGIAPPQAPDNNAESRLDRTTTQIMDGTTGPQRAVSGGDERADPNHTPLSYEVRLRLSNMLKNGRPDSEIRDYARDVGISPESVGRALDWRAGRINPGEYREWRRQRPNDIYPMIDEAPNVPMSGIESFEAMAARSPVGTAATQFGNAIIPSAVIAQATGGNPELTRAAIDAQRRENPGWALGGQLAGAGSVFTGGGAAANALSGGTRGALSRFLATPAQYGTFAPRAMAGDAAYGALQGWGENDDPLGGAAMSLGGGMAFRGGARALEGTRNRTTRALTGEGVPLTLGQMGRARGGYVGNAIGGLEDRLAGFPGLDSLINNRRLESLEGFNQAAFRRAGRPIGAEINATGPVGVGQGQRATGQAYDAALDPVTVNVDAPFMGDWQAARVAGEAIPNVGNEAGFVFDQAANVFQPGGALTGRDFQAAREYFRQARGTAGPGPMQQPFRNAMTQGEDALTGLVERQSPGTVPALRNADRAYRRFSILGDATFPAQRGARPEELITPANLASASVNNTINFGGRNAARAGETPFRNLTRLGTVIPNRVPDSGTAGREAMLLAGSALAGSTIGGGSGFAQGGDAGSAISGAQDGGLLGTMLALGLLAPGTRLGRTGLQMAMTQRPRRVRTVGRRAVPYSGMFGAGLANYDLEDEY